MSQTATVCAYCGVGCGMVVKHDPAGPHADTLIPHPHHPANQGRCCAKGATLLQTLSPDGRLHFPMLHGHRVSWTRAIDHIAGGFRDIIDKHGPDAVGFYVSGQFLTEDYYVANKLMKGFIGSANIDTNSRLCMASTVVGHTRAFGADTVPGCYEDLDLADLVVITGSNMAACHPVLFQRLMERKQATGKPEIIVIDPRRSETAAQADLHLPIKPGADAYLFNGLLDHLNRAGCLDFDFLENHVQGFSATLRAAAAFNLPGTAARCGLSERVTAAFMSRFARNHKVVTIFSQGINQSSSGCDKVNAILNCHLATGRIGKPGCGPLSLTGQGNAMGGREVGGLANQLAARLAFDNEEHLSMLRSFWGAPDLAQRPGLKASALFEAVAEGRVKALWIACTNPAVSMPNSELIRKALARCSLLVVSECMADTETAAFAEVLLPATTWGEKSGTVTNSERCISRQRPFREAPGEAKPDWWAFSAVARAMGFTDAFDYETEAQIFREHAALSGLNNNGTRDFDISGLSEISDSDYDRLQPIQWPINAAYPEGRARLFDDGRFFHADGRARMIPIEPRLPQHQPDTRYPLMLLTGRLPDQWHTMSRTGDIPALRRRDAEPFIAIHPDDASASGFDEHASGLATIETAFGRFQGRLDITEDQQRGTLFAPFHWGEAYAKEAKPNHAVNPALDPLSGQPEFKATPATAKPLDCGCYGFVISKVAIDPPRPLYWVHVPGTGFHRYEFALEESVANARAWVLSLWREVTRVDDRLVFNDEAEGSFRAAYLANGKLQACVFLASRRALPARAWVEALFLKDQLALAERRGLLAGMPC